MPISRPVLIALVGAILAAATFFATSASRQDASAPDTDPAELNAQIEKAESAKVKQERAAESAPAKPKAVKSTAAAPAKPAPPKVAGVPPSVKRALDKKRVVILFFRQRGSADDRAVASSVNAQRGRKGVSVFSANIARLARYRAVVGTLGIAQAPAVVIVGRNGEAKVVEGFVDEGSLTQQVVDSR